MERHDVEGEGEFGVEEGMAWLVFLLVGDVGSEEGWFSGVDDENPDA